MDYRVVASTSMSELSLAAQAVLDAFDAKQDEMHEVTWLTRNPDRDCIAAALRVAADQLTPYTVSEMDGAAFARNKLIDIATELEAQ